MLVSDWQIPIVIRFNLRFSRVRRFDLTAGDFIRARRIFDLIRFVNFRDSTQVLKNRIGHKVTGSVFWDREGVLMIDYLQQGKNVTVVYYAGLAHKLHESVKEKCQSKLTHWCCFTTTMQ